MTAAGNGHGSATGSGSGGALDDAALVRRVDAGGMLIAIASTAEQIRDGWARTRALHVPDSYRGLRAVCVLGMGGSAIGADLVAGIWSDRLRVPLVVVRGYDLPAWVDSSTLVVASSNSGNTEETISALGAAMDRHAPVAAITTGGALREAARRASLPLLEFPGGGMPRAAAGYATTLTVGLLERCGMVESTEAEVDAAITAARVAIAAWGPDVPTEANAAKQLAWALIDRLPVVEAAGFLGPVARRWKTQFNENSKSMGVWEELPEATHNTVVGYPHPETVRDHLHVIFLTSPLDHPRNRLRASLSAAALDDALIAHRDVPVSGDGRFAQAMSGVLLGDYTSTYLAVLYGTDPTPIEVLDRIKGALGNVSLTPSRPAAKE